MKENKKLHGDENVSRESEFPCLNHAVAIDVQHEDAFNDGLLEVHDKYLSGCQAEPAH